MNPSTESNETFVKQIRKSSLYRAYERAFRKATGLPLIMVTLLAIFSIQLGNLANQLMLEQHASQPSIVTIAKRYIAENLCEPINLEDVARQAGVSTYYFCKVFKQSTGMTFTQYVNRKRIEVAKRELLRPNLPVTTIAYDVGYQSLSQFNRNFLRYVGESPTAYRKRLRQVPVRELTLAC